MFISYHLINNIYYIINPKYKAIRICKSLKNKHIYKSKDSSGEEIINYYFMYSDSSVELVSKESFNKFKINQTLCWTTNRYTNK